MTAPALVKRSDMMRAAQVANETGCRIEIKVGDSVITVIPDVPKTAGAKGRDGIDYSRPVL